MDQATMWEANRGRLSELAARAGAKGHAAKDILIVCIDVDTSWRDVVDELMPGYDWQAYRDRGELPIARGSVMRAGFGDYLCAAVPDIAHLIRSAPPPGMWHAVVMTAGNATVYLVESKPETN